MEIKIPISIQEMATTLKLISNQYKEGGLKNDEFYKSVLFLKSKRPDLFESALTKRYVGERRKKLINAILLNQNREN